MRPRSRTTAVNVPKRPGWSSEILAQDQSSVAGLLLKARMALDAHDTAGAREYAHKAAAVAPEAPAVREFLAALSEPEP